jgi:hypothetical protein
VSEVTLYPPAAAAAQTRLRESTIIYVLTVSALWIFFFADFCNKLLIHLHFDFVRISIFPRALYEFLFFAVILTFINKTRSAFLIILAVMFVFFLIGQTIFSLHIDYPYNFTENLFIFNKYFFLFVVYFGIYKLQDNPELFARVIRIMEKLFLLNAYLALVGVVFGIDIFRTYIHQSYRFGYSGVFWVQNESTIFYYCAILYFYYKRFILKIKSKGIFVVLLASVFLGTKGIYLFMALLLLFHFAYHSSLKTKIYSFIIMISVYWLTVWFMKSEQAKVLLAYFVSKMNKEGVWYMLFSGRTRYLGEINDKILSFWTPLNYIFGGQDQSRFMVEMDLFDLFLFFGISGFIVYFILIFSSIFRLRLTRPFNLFFFFSYMLLAFFGGHFFSSVITALYLCLISMYFYSTQNQPPLPQKLPEG